MSYISPEISDSTEIYSLLSVMAESILEGEDDWVCGTANISALIYDLLPDLNWAGFYRVVGDQLVLGPFQGKPACTRIAMGKGVCGTAWQTNLPQVVPDVHKFPGHIACDGASNSELVIPIHNQYGQFCGLLDLDSPVKDRFSQEDLRGFTPCIDIIEKWLANHEIDWFC